MLLTLRGFLLTLFLASCLALPLTFKNKEEFQKFGRPFEKVILTEADLDAQAKAFEETSAGLYEADPYKWGFKALAFGYNVVDFVNDNILAVHKILSVPVKFMSNAFNSFINKFRNMKPEERVKLFQDSQFVQLMTENKCPGIYWQENFGAPWTIMPINRLIQAVEIDFEGVVARMCLSLDDQKKYLFGEYRFTRHSENGTTFLSPKIIPNDKVPLMAKVSRQGALAWRMIEKQGACKTDITSCFEFSKQTVLTDMKAAFPWAAKYVEDKCVWVFNTAGGGLAHLCYLYGSISENVVFWGSPIGNMGFSGSYDAKVWDHMLYGIMETFEVGQLNALVQYAGQFHLLNKFSGNYYRINRNCYMLDYVQGNVAQTMKFAIIVPTEYHTLDYRMALKSICQYATLVVKNMENQGAWNNDVISIIAIWKKLLGVKDGGQLDTTVCKFMAGLDPDAAANMEGEVLDDAELKNFSTPLTFCVERDEIFNTLMKIMLKASDARNKTQIYRQELSRAQEALSAYDNLVQSVDFAQARCAQLRPDQLSSVEKARVEIANGLKPKRAMVNVN